MDVNESTLLSRRSVVAGLAASGLVAACKGGAGAVEAAPSAATAGEKLATGTMADWAARAGTVFQAGGGVALTLAGVEPLPSSGTRPADAWRPAAFLAAFDASAAMPGGLIYALTAPGIGPVDVFVTEAPSDAFPRRMLAVFN